MRKTKRIYYGPDENPCALWWDVKWSPAKKGVVINGNLEHAIEGIAGSSIGCRLSNVAFDEKNKSAFPHDVYLAAFYKSTALIVDHVAENGTPAHAVVYEHDYADIIDLNDLGNLEPVYKDKRFYLRPPRNRVGEKQKKTTPPPEGGGTPAKEIAFNALRPTHNEAGEVEKAEELEENFHPSIHRASVPRFQGAMGRAVKSGRVGRPAANQLTRAIHKKV